VNPCWKARSPYIRGLAALENCFGGGRTGIPCRPNVRAEATDEAGRLGAAQDNGACDCPARRQGGLPRWVASRARG